MVKPLPPRLETGQKLGNKRNTRLLTRSVQERFQSRGTDHVRDGLFGPGGFTRVRKFRVKQLSPDKNTSQGVGNRIDWGVVRPPLPSLEDG